jgi:hypothetical protein
MAVAETGIESVKAEVEGDPKAGMTVIKTISTGRNNLPLSLVQNA